MPNNAMPEGNVILSSDGELRTLFKIASMLYDAGGAKPCPFPELSQPLVSDNEQRLSEKINAMLAT